MEVSEYRIKYRILLGKIKRQGFEEDFIDDTNLTDKQVEELYYHSRLHYIKKIQAMKIKTICDYIYLLLTLERH